MEFDWDPEKQLDSIILHMKDIFKDIKVTYSYIDDMQITIDGNTTSRLASEIIDLISKNVDCKCKYNII